MELPPLSRKIAAAAACPENSDGTEPQAVWTEGNCPRGAWDCRAPGVRVGSRLLRAPVLTWPSSPGPGQEVSTCRPRLVLALPAPTAHLGHPPCVQQCCPTSQPQMQVPRQRGSRTPWPQPAFPAQPRPAHPCERLGLICRPAPPLRVLAAAQATAPRKSLASHRPWGLRVRLEQPGGSAAGEAGLGCSPTLNGARLGARFLRGAGQELLPRDPH